MPSIFASAGREGADVAVGVGEGRNVGTAVELALGFVKDHGVLDGSGVSVGIFRTSSTDEVCGTAAKTCPGSC